MKRKTFIITLLIIEMCFAIFCLNGCKDKKRAKDNSYTERPIGPNSGQDPMPPEPVGQQIPSANSN